MNKTYKIMLFSIVFFSVQSLSFNAEEVSEITTCQQLSYMDSNTNYTLNSDLDCGGLNLYPESNTFNGSFNGNGNTISNFNIPGSLFGTTSSSANITNIQFSNINVTRSGDSHSGLIAKDNYGTISNVIVTDSTIKSNTNVGGIVGNNYGTISDSNVANTEIESNEDDAGGIAGYNNGTISNSTLTNGSRVTGRQHVGGIAGLQDTNGTTNSSSLLDSKSIIKGTNYVGGIIGDNHGKILDSTINNIKIRVNSNLIDFKSQYNFGGIVGKNEDAGYINNTIVENFDIDIDGEVIGGFVGQNDGLIENSYVSSSLINGENNTGGFAGKNYGDIVYSSVFSSTINGRENTGGFVGFDDEYLKKNQVTGSQINGSKFVGGFAGVSESDSSIKKSFVSDSNIVGTEYVGGFIGHIHKSNVEDSYASTNTSGDRYIGGFAGEIGSSANVTQTYSSGNVSGTHENIGGYSGNLWDNPNVKYSFTTSDVQGYKKVGAFTGDKDRRADLRRVYVYENTNVTSTEGLYTHKDIRTASDSDLSSSSFYKNTLEFATDRWDLDSILSVNDLPKLR